MWYEAGWLGAAAYAESADGMNWERKNLPVRPGTNALFPEGTVRFDSWVVTPDFAAADPYSRWLLFVRPPGGGAQKSYVAESRDGLEWGELKEAGKCGDRSTVFYNPFRRKWAFRRYSPPPEQFRIPDRTVPHRIIAGHPSLL